MSNYCESGCSAPVVGYVGKAGLCAVCMDSLLNAALSGDGERVVQLVDPNGPQP